MRNRIVILISLVVMIGIVVAISLPAGGTCSTGINKTHLDPAPGAFVDNTTIEINSTNGLQIKPAYINEKVGSGSINPSTYAGQQSVTFPNGLIMKFGNEPVSATETTVTFISAFPNSCLTVVACGGSATDTSWDYAIYTSNLSASSFKIRVRLPSRQTPIRWIAIGY